MLEAHGANQGAALYVMAPYSEAVFSEMHELDQLEELRGCYAHYGPCSSCWVTCGIERLLCLLTLPQFALMAAHQSLLMIEWNGSGTLAAAAEP